MSAIIIAILEVNKTVLFADSFEDVTKQFPRGGNYYILNESAFQHQFAWRHIGKSNVLFTGGNVRSLQADNSMLTTTNYANYQPDLNHWLRGNPRIRGRNFGELDF